MENNRYQSRYATRQKTRVVPVASQVTPVQSVPMNSHQPTEPIGSPSPETPNKKRFKRTKKQKKTRFLRRDGLLVVRLPKSVDHFMAYCSRHRLLTRTVSLTIALLLLGIVGYEAFNEYFKDIQYKISPKAEALLVNKSDELGNKLVYDSQAGAYEFNKDYSPNNGEVAGQISGPKFSAKFRDNPNEGLDITDPQYGIGFTMKPKFGLNAPQKDGNRLIFPLNGKKAAKIVTLRSVGYKEDIILEQAYGDTMTFKYDLVLPDALEARIENDGSLGIYGPENTVLMGNVTTGTDKDAELLKNAQKNAKKTKLVFRMPAPFIKEYGSRVVKRTANFSLDKNILTLKAEQLKDLRYPISIDPTVYIETALKLMRGNNETNIDFDIDDELFQKSQTTGARIDAWQGNLDFNNGTWDHGVAAAGGYIYRTGGRTDPTKPQIVDQRETLQNSNSTTFTMNMPSTRPAGDLYIALMCYDGDQGDGSGGSTAGNTISTPSGWTKYANRNGHAAYYKVGTDQGGGNESATYQFTGDSEEWGGVILRVTGFNSGDPISGTEGVGHSNSNAVPVFPATTPDSDSTLVIRATGVDADEPSATAWVPSGHTKIASGGSTGGNDCAYAAASLDTPPASGVSTGTATLADGSLSDVYGASSIAINPATVTAGTEDAVQWAKFNSSTLAIESPNPGAGACSGWCSNSVYDLPEARRGHSMVAYNGYLYVIGGTDGTNRESTVLVAKLGANGEPQLWHPTGGTPAYWYSDTGLNGGTARSYMTAVAYNNRMYVLGGQTNASPGGVTTVEYADIKPNGTLGTWTAGTALPSARHGHTTHVYNDYIYLMGGNSSGTLQNSVYYTKITAATGAIGAWTATTSFTTARSSWGGSFTAVWGAYVYLTGGCSAVNGSGYCTTVASDTQLGSINADGTISEWTSIGNLTNQRMGYSITGWQGGLYRLGGCAQQNTTTGVCINALADVDYGTVNPAGEVSTVDITVPSGTSPCSGGSPYSCDLPPPGDDAGEGGQMLSMSVIMNGYLYVIGGCIDYDCNGTSPAGDDADVTGNISYVSVDSNGRLTAPATCGGTSYGAWCVDSTNRINGTTGIAAGGVATFGGRIYVVGGLTGSGISTNIYYNSVNTNGSLAGAWSSVDMTTAGIAEDVAYTYVFTRANPASAGSNPGNLYVLGGCGNNTGGAGCGASDYETEVYKCNITTAGSVSGCTTTGQLQIDAELEDESDEGLGIHSGTIYANYIYLIGGFSPAVGDRNTIYYAKIDNSNNIVSVATNAAGGDNDDWILDDSTLSVGRRRGWAFGYNGHIYSVGGYDASGTGIIPFIEWSKMNVSDGSIDPFVTSTVTINQRWGLSMVVSNSYAYVIGGCDVGASPSSCTSFENSIQTFQLYNNSSGAPASYGASANVLGTDRMGHGAAVLNGYIYVAGGCTGTSDCATLTTSVERATLDGTTGAVGGWSATTAALPAARAWGKLVAAGGTLYWIGGRDSSGFRYSTIYYAVPASGNVTSWGTASNGLPSQRERFGVAVWDNRIYVLGGLNGSGRWASTYISPKVSSTVSSGDIPSAWTTSTSFNVQRSGLTAIAYANNLYVLGGDDGTNYLSDVQFASLGYKTGTISQTGTTVTGSGTTFTSAMVGSTLQYPDGSTATITAYSSATSITVSVDKSVAGGTSYVIQDGSVGSWGYTTSLPTAITEADGFAVNGYMYLVGGRTASTTCVSKTLLAPISANTTIATNNNPTGVGEWYETNRKYTGDRYGASVAYNDGKLYVTGGACGSPLTYTGANSVVQTTIISQPQVAIYSRMIDTDTDVFPNSWLMNGVDNSIGARWQMKYRTMHDISDGASQQNPNEDCGTSASMPVMTTWGQETTYGDVILGDVAEYIPKESGGSDINCARYFYFYVSIDASKTFGYPEDVERGPTISDLSLFFTADPSKRLRHGKSFTGGEQQPLDTPCRQSNDTQCPLP